MSTYVYVAYGDVLLYRWYCYVLVCQSLLQQAHKQSGSQQLFVIAPTSQVKN